MTDIALVIDQGDDEVIDITIVDPDSTPTDLTDCKLWFYVKERISDPDSAAVLAKDSDTNGGITIAADPTDGTAEVAIADTETAGLASDLLDRKLRWSLQVRDGSQEALITTLAKGTLLINRDLITATT
jgi:hypothetical protein